MENKKPSSFSPRKLIKRVFYTQLNDEVPISANKEKKD